MQSEKGKTWTRKEKPDQTASSPRLPTTPKLPGCPSHISNLSAPVWPNVKIPGPPCQSPISFPSFPISRGGGGEEEKEFQEALASWMERFLKLRIRMGRYPGERGNRDSHGLEIFGGKDKEHFNGRSSGIRNFDLNCQSKYLVEDDGPVRLDTLGSEVMTMGTFLLSGMAQELQRRNLEENSDLFEGDIVIPIEEEQAIEAGEASGGIVGNHFRWPEGIVPYSFSPDFTPTEIRVVEGSMREISEKTQCIRFKPRVNEKNYIRIEDGLGCTSNVGMINEGGQILTLNRPGCVNHGNAMHELVHALGFFHEQSRLDRDNYVTVLTQNINPKRTINFQKYTSREGYDFGVPYDYSSLMHYPESAFQSEAAVLQGLKTLVPKRSGVEIGQRRYLSELDTLKIIRMYCPEREASFVIRARPESTTTEKPNVITLKSRFGKLFPTGTSPWKRNLRREDPSKIVLILPGNVLTEKKNSSLLPEESADLFEGDIVIPQEEEELLETGEASAGIIGSHYRWQHAIVPFEISDAFKKPEVRILEAAMAEISAKTCIRFKPREQESNFIIFQDGKGCSSQVGRQGGRRGQAVTLSRDGGCVAKGTAIHELVHVIGFWHEQSRTDRDNYVVVKLSNVPEEKRHNFDKYTTQDVNDFGVPYDYNSVMHYPDRAFISTEALQHHEKTIVPRDPRAHIGQRKYLSKLDAEKINRMYQCPGRSETTTSTTTTTTTTTPTTTTTTTESPDERGLIFQSRLQPFYNSRPQTTTRRYYNSLWNSQMTTTTTTEPSTSGLWQTFLRTTTAPLVPKISINRYQLQSWKTHSMSAWKRKQLEKSKYFVNDFFQRDREDSLEEVQPLESSQGVTTSATESNDKIEKQIQE
ncbi:unnamed protein product [Allacma fusca]|uniref:Peptidase M12A domain-containing protein n=1 Tax=Allacma fusca TaxID=39272 RepID=A0A8J2PIN8_9HEXA|nr:unnamed protein product [Allacma fusca]